MAGSPHFPIIDPGVYWVFSSEVKRPTGAKVFPFVEWRMLPDVRPSVAFRKVRPHLDESPRTEWILFEVTAPVLYTEDAARGAGKPSIAPKGLDTEEEDVVQAPSVDTVELPDFLANIAKGAGTLGFALLAWLVYDTFFTKRRR